MLGLTTATELFPPPLPEPLDDVFVVWELPEALPLAELLEPLPLPAPFADERPVLARVADTDVVAA